MPGVTLCHFTASDGGAQDTFGAGVSLSGDTIIASAGAGGGGNQLSAYFFRNCNTSPLVVSVSAASFAAGGGLAPESIVAAFGSSLASGIQAASTQPLPTKLAGISMWVKDSAGAERLAPLFFVSPGQINYQVPPGTANGPATVTVTSGAASIATGAAHIASVAPGLFSANSNGQGVAAAGALRVRANGAQQFEPVARFDEAQMTAGLQIRRASAFNSKRTGLRGLGRGISNAGISGEGGFTTALALSHQDIC